MASDPSTEAIKAKLATPRSRNVVEAHGGIASVATDGGAKPRMHDSAGDNAATNAVTNAALADAGRATPRKQPTPGQLVAADIITNQ
jgi:hypothetical protein